MKSNNKLPNSIPVSLNTANAFAAAGAELGSSSLKILKFTKFGEWVTGTDRTPVTETRFAANVREAKRGYVCFVGGKFVEEVMVPIADGGVVNPDELTDHGPYEKKDGWRESVSIQLRGLESGEEYVYPTSSHGGLATIGYLLSAYARRLGIGKNDIPIIEAKTGSYVHPDYGEVFKPILKIIEWRTEEALMNENAADLGQEIRDEEIPF